MFAAAALEHISAHLVHRARPLSEIASMLLNEGLSFSATSQPEDDLTIFLLRFR
jgi:hypothetical protein